MYCREYVDAQVAQLAEHVLGKDEVGGSSPLLGLLFKELKTTTNCIMDMGNFSKRISAERI